MRGVRGVGACGSSTCLRARGFRGGTGGRIATALARADAVGFSFPIIARTSACSGVPFRGTPQRSLLEFQIFRASTHFIYIYIEF